MDIKKAEEKLKSADSFLTTLKDLLKKHWGILSILGLFGFGYWAMNLPDEEVEVEHESKPKVEEHHKAENSKDYYITKKTYIIDDYGYRKGDTVYIDYYSDGVVEKYYTDYKDYDPNK